MGWSDPFWLLGLILVGPILWLGGFKMRGNKISPSTSINDKPLYPRNTILKRLTFLRAVTVVMVVLALARTSVLLPSRNRNVVLIFDTSTSISRTQIEKSRNMALQYIQRLAPADQIAVVTFAKKPTVIFPLITTREAGTILESAPLKSDHPEQSNIQAALRVAVELLKGYRGNCSILLFSDGRSTSGGLLSDSLININPGNIPIHTVPLGEPRNGLLAKGLELPELVHPGENIQALWKIETSRSQNINFSLKMDDRIIKRGNVTLRSGQNTIPLTITAPKSGFCRIEVTASNEKGRLIKEGTGEGVLKVSGVSQVLILNGYKSSNTALYNALSVQGIQVTERSIAEIPDSANWLSNFAAVILDNIPALYLSENQQNMLQSYVAGGGGLLVIGGDSSLGRGDYYATGLEDMLPVQTDTRQRLMFSRANILFVIDHSGSMSEMVGGTSKQLAAMKGVVAAVNELNPQDEVGILTFDTQPSWTLPFTPVSQKNRIIEAISGMSEGGGTDMAAAIHEIIRSFQVPGPIRRHVVILTDGLTQTADFKKLSRTLRELGVTVTTIGIGEEINESLLRDMARWGEGRFYRANLDKIPTVIQKETIRITRDLIQEGVFQPQIKVGTAFLNGLEGALLPVKGYLITKPKNLATVYLQVGKADPLLAGWRYGNGQVYVFTADSGLRWLALWSGKPVYNLLWSQLVRFIERPNLSQGFRMATKVEAGATEIIVEAIGADQRLKPGLHLIGHLNSHPEEAFNFQEISPGRYQAKVALSEPGIVQFEIQEQRGKEWTMGWLWNPPGFELSELGPDRAGLTQLSSMTGGKFMELNLPLPPQRLTWEPINLQNWLVGLALLLFIAELAYRSTALGQISMARAVIESWWAAQLRIMEMVRGVKKADLSATESQRTMEAYRYLAERARKHKEESKDA